MQVGSIYRHAEEMETQHLPVLSANGLIAVLLIWAERALRETRRPHAKQSQISSFCGINQARMIMIELESKLKWMKNLVSEKLE